VVQPLSGDCSTTAEPWNESVRRMRISLRNMRHVRMSVRNVRVVVAGEREVLAAASNLWCQLE